MILWRLGSVMSSKILWALTLMLSLTACDRFLKKNDQVNAQAEQVKIEFKEGECLKDVPAQIQKFLDDEGGLESSFPCVQTALKSFMKLTRGSQADSYTGKELQEFFNIYLLKENKISNEFLEDIMKLKVVVVGGAADVATRTELEKFVDFLGLLEKELGRYQGRIRVISFKADFTKVDENQINTLRMDISSSADFLLKNTKLLSAQYQWSDFLGFLGHLHQFLGQMKDLDEVMKWLPLIDSAKALFLGENSKLLTQKDWTETKNWVVSSYAAILKFNYLIRRADYHAPVSWVVLMNWMDSLVVTLETAPMMKDKKIFEAGAIDRVIDELYKKEIFKTKLPAELIKQTYRKVLAYFVEPSDVKADPLKIIGISEEHLKVIKAEYQIWKAIQVFLTRSFNEEPQQSLESLRNRFKNIDGKGFPVVSATDRPEYNQAWQDFYRLITADQVILPTDKLKLQVNYQGLSSPVSFSGMSLMNGERTLARFAMKGYGDRLNQSAFKKRISMKRMIDLEENFREFGRAVGFFDPDKTSAGKETFDQANLLVYHSNGDQWVDGTELTELLGFLISGGQFSLNQIYDDLKTRNCLLSGDPDVFDKPWVDEKCFIAAFRQQTSVYFDNIPQMAKYLNALTDSQFAQAYQYLLKVSQGPRHRPGQLDSGEIRTMSTILHFVEGIVVMYDRNRNTVLSVAELNQAFPRFKALISEAALKENLLAGFVLDDIFLYLVYNSQKPGTIDLGEFIIQKNLGNLGEVDKLRILKLLGVMKDLMANAPAK